MKLANGYGLKKIGVGFVFVFYFWAEHSRGPCPLEPHMCESGWQYEWWKAYFCYWIV